MHKQESSINMQQGKKKAHCFMKNLAVLATFFCVPSSWEGVGGVLSHLVNFMFYQQVILISG